MCCRTRHLPRLLLLLHLLLLLLGQVITFALKINVLGSSGAFAGVGFLVTRGHSISERLLSQQENCFQRMYGRWSLSLLLRSSSSSICHKENPISLFRKVSFPFSHSLCFFPSASSHSRCMLPSVHSSVCLPACPSCTGQQRNQYRRRFSYNC